MTTFQDGPAHGQTLMLKRAPVYLRVTSWHQTDGIQYDALDQLNDVPEPDEYLMAYVLVTRPTMSHINRGRHGSGFYPIATYRLVQPQPNQCQMSDTERWRQWTTQQPRPDFAPEPTP